MMRASVLLGLLVCAGLASAQQACNRPNIAQATCGCPNGDGGEQTIDFSVLKDPSTGYLKGMFEGYYYYFQMTNGGLSPGGMDICTFINPPASNPAGAQVPIQGGDCYNLGVVSQQTWSITNPGSDMQSVTITFQGGDSAAPGPDRSMLVVVTCDRSKTGVPQLGDGFENPPLTYNFAISHISACPESPPPPPPSPSPSPPPPSPSPSPPPPSPAPPSPGPSPYSPPTVPNSFEARITVATNQGSGQGYWFADSFNKKTVLSYNGAISLFQLDRFDLGKEFVLAADNVTCKTNTLSQPMSSPWSWLPLAGYQGRTTSPSGQLIDVWSAAFGGVQFETGIIVNSNSTPAYLKEQLDGSFNNITFQSFVATLCIEGSYFDVPKACQTQQEVEAGMMAKKQSSWEVPAAFEAKLALKTTTESKTVEDTGVFMVRGDLSYVYDPSANCFQQVKGGNIPSRSWFDWIAIGELTVQNTTETWTASIADVSMSFTTESGIPSQIVREVGSSKTTVDILSFQSARASPMFC